MSEEGGFRNKRRAPFTMLANAMLRNPALSLQAKGLLGVMLSFPDDWQYYMKHLGTLSTNGREAHQNALKELLALGYVIRHEERGERGRIQYQYEVSDTALERTPEDATATGLPATVNRQRSTGNGEPAPTKTDSTKTVRTKKERVARPKKEVPRNLHFDAIVTALYPQGKISNASHVARVAKALQEAEWTPEDIHHVLSAAQRDTFWKKALTLGSFEKHAEDWRRRYGRARKEEVRPRVVTDETTPADDLDWTGME